jgi:NAD(P)-dependent dehydrogenase (short-subunit alcohol dehydrogenase family)
MKLANKVALITGAGSGIGQATALLFAQEGAAVAAMDLNQDAAAATVDRIGAMGGKALAITGDVSQEADARRMVEETVRHFGRLDILYNNAGIAGAALNTIGELGAEDFDRVIAVNMRSVFLGIKYAVEPMKRQGGGVIVSTASQAAFMAVYGLAPYCASKSGVVALTRTAALEYAPFNIRVNCVCPGIIDTPLINRSVEQAEAGAQSWEINALGRRGRPEEIARTVLFLASDDSSYVSGAPFSIDGGMMFG